MSASLTGSGDATTYFLALLMLGRERGFLTPDDVVQVLSGVELTPELISGVVGRVTAEGIEWRDHDEPISDEGLDRLGGRAHKGAAAGRARRRRPTGEDVDQPGTVRGQFGRSHGHR